MKLQRHAQFHLDDGRTLPIPTFFSQEVRLKTEPSLPSA